MGKEDGNKVIKAGAGYVIGNYLLKGITFLSAPIFTRLLSTEEYGDFGAYSSYASMFYIIVGLALHSSINNAKYKYKEKFDEYVSSLVVLTCFSTLLWLILANVFYNQYATFIDFSRTIINIMVIHCFASSMFEVFNVYVSLSYSVKSFMTITSINALGNMGLSVILILTFFTDNRLIGRIVGVVTPLALIAAYIVWYFFKKSKPIVRIEYWRFGLLYSIPIIPHGISQIILSSFDRIMIKKMVGASEAGLYSFSYTICTLIAVFSSSLDKVWKPWFYERMDEKDYDTIKEKGTDYALGIALVTILALMVAPEIIIILGDREYWGTTNCVVPVVVGGYFSFIYLLPVLVEYFYGKTQFIAAGTMVAAGINIVLNYIFIPQFGYIAAAYTTLVTYLLYFTFHFILASKIHGKSLFDVFKLYGISICVVVVGAISMLLEKHFVIRWGIEIIILLLAVYWAESKFGVITLVKKRIKK